MSIICPALLATDLQDFNHQMDNIKAFAKRIQIDLKDNDFATGQSIPLADITWPITMVADIHMMYRNPQSFLPTLLLLKPNMVIVHAESNCDVPKLAADLRDASIKTGLAILQSTTVESVSYILPHVQHLLIFSGNLGHFGGSADLKLISKIAAAKKINQYLEIGWDGGVNLDNASHLAAAGVDVLDVGGFIQNAPNPQEAYVTIKTSLNAD